MRSTCTCFGVTALLGVNNGVFGPLLTDPDEPEMPFEFQLATRCIRGSPGSMIDEGAPRLLPPRPCISL